MADAVAEGSKTLGKMVDSADKVAGCFVGMFRQLGGMAEDTVKHYRLKNWLNLRDKAQVLLQERGIDSPTRDIPPKFAVRFLTSASLEEDDELQGRWAQMLANAADGSSKVELRTAYIDILKDLTVIDVKILEAIGKLSDSDLLQHDPPGIQTAKLPDDADVQTTMSGYLELPSDDVVMSLSNLSRTGCITNAAGWGGASVPKLVYITPIGLGLYRACTRPRSSSDVWPIYSQG